MDDTRGVSSIFTSTLPQRGVSDKSVFAEVKANALAQNTFAKVSVTLYLSGVILPYE